MNKPHSYQPQAIPKLLIASNNKGKAIEIQELLLGKPLNIVSAAEFTLDSPEETGKTFSENAILKAKYYSEATGLMSLADDSGLEVLALDGDPGIFSARWMGEDLDPMVGIKRIQKALEEKNTDDYRARFVCCLCLYMTDGNYEVFEGTVEGTLTFPPKGTTGFGYDPIFIPSGYNETFGEMNPIDKQCISHRANAFAKFSGRFFS